MGILYSKGVRYSGSGKIDATLSTSSANAIANSAVATAINQINSDLTNLRAQGTTYATLQTALNSLTELQFIKSKLMLGVAILNPDNSAYKTYVRRMHTSASTVAYYAQVVNATGTHEEYQKNTNGSMVTSTLTINDWKLYY